MIRPCNDIAFFNEVSNHPSVRPHVLPEGRKSCFIDVEPAFTRLGAIGLCSDYGGFVLVPNEEEGALDAHGMWMPQPNRFERAKHDTAEALLWVFQQNRWNEVIIPVPHASANRGTGALLSSVGMAVMDTSSQHVIYAIDKDRHWTLLKQGFYDTMLDYSE